MVNFQLEIKRVDQNGLGINRKLDDEDGTLETALT